MNLKLIMVACIGGFVGLSAYNLTIEQLHDAASKYPEDSLYYDQPFVKRLFGEKKIEPIVSIEESTAVVHDLIDHYEHSLSQSDAWFNGSGSRATSPYIQKAIIPAGAHIAVFSDIHGSFQSLLRAFNYLINRGYLAQDFSIRDKNFYMIFLGDNIDRGFFSPEVLYGIARLKLASPNNVYLLAGNHEMLDAWPTNWQQEFEKRYGDGVQALLSKYGRGWPLLFSLLPRALYTGVKNNSGNFDYILFAHGAFDVEKNVTPFLATSDNIHYCTGLALGNTMTSSNFKHAYTEPGCASSENFNRYTRDYFDDIGTNAFIFSHDHCIWGDKWLSDWFSEINVPPVTVHALVRGHQHASGKLVEQLEAGFGYAALMANKVHTLFSGAAAGGTYLPFDSFLLITTAPTFDQWTGKHVYRQVGGLYSDINTYVSSLKKRKSPTPMVPDASTGKEAQLSTSMPADTSTVKVPMIPNSSIDIDRTIPWQERAITFPSVMR